MGCVLLSVCDNACDRTLQAWSCLVHCLENEKNRETQNIEFGSAALETNSLLATGATGDREESKPLHWGCFMM